MIETSTAVHAPAISVIIPAHNAAEYLPRSLAALEHSTFRDFECIVVDDYSTDKTRDVARQFCDTVLVNGDEAGPAGARNFAAGVARGEILLFLDADVCIKPDTLGLVHAAFHERPEVAAVFGSYDDAPADRSPNSLFKNLFHHYIHQHGAEDATTFWTGCGAVRRQAFAQLGGFKTATITRMEDVEYGHRLIDAGKKIWLRHDIQVQHLKRWTIGNLIYTDVMKRGIPWTVMMLQRGRSDADLNLSAAQKIAAVFACSVLPAFVASFYLLLHYDEPLWIAVPFVLILLVVVINAQLFRLFVKRVGWTFAFVCIPKLLLYYHYSAFALLAGFYVFARHRRELSDRT